MQLSIITGNSGKFKDYKLIFPDCEQIAIDLDEIQSLDSQAIIRHKLNQARTKVPNGAIVVDDVSVHIEVFGGFPGPLIKWFNEAIGYERISELVNQLGNTRVSVTCTIGFDDGQTQQFFTGGYSGTFVPARGEHSWGFGPFIEIEGLGKTIAELPHADQQQYHHRGQAMQKLRAYLNKVKI